jgi:FtsZ-binding cell division protein ZapB
MENSFANLEEKVLEAVRLIQSLRGENSQLKQDVDGLTTRCDTLRADNERLQHELEAAQSAVVDADAFEERRRAIEEKVGGLLEKLEALG